MRTNGNRGAAQPRGPGRFPRRSLVVHVGPAKTGSRSIQHVLDRFAPTLEQLGVHVPAAAARGGRHPNLAATAPGSQQAYYNRFLWGGWQELCAELRRCGAPRFVVSAVQLSRPGAGPESAARTAMLAEAAALDVTVIGYARPQWELVESLWGFRVARGDGRAPFAAALAGLLGDPRLDFATVFGPWRERFGARLSVYPLERSRLPHGLAAHFLGTIGVDDPALTAAVAGVRRNRRLGAKELEVRRVVAVALRRGGAGPGQRDRAMGRLGGLHRCLADDRPFAGLTGAQAREVAARFAAANADFARTFGVDAGGVLFRDPLPTDGPGRPNLATWEHLDAAERDAVRGLVRAELGVELAPRGRPSAHRQPASGAPSMDAGGVREPLGRRCGRAWREVAALVRRTRRAGRQIRRGAAAWRVLRWVRWEARGSFGRVALALRGGR